LVFPQTDVLGTPVD
jgi:hypothetical protein